MRGHCRGLTSRNPISSLPCRVCAVALGRQGIAAFIQQGFPPLPKGGRLFQLPAQVGLVWRKSFRRRKTVTEVFRGSRIDSK